MFRGGNQNTRSQELREAYVSFLNPQLGTRLRGGSPQDKSAIRNYFSMLYAPCSMPYANISWPDPTFDQQVRFPPGNTEDKLSAHLQLVYYFSFLRLAACASGLLSLLAPTTDSVWILQDFVNCRGLGCAIVGPRRKNSVS